MRTIYCGQIRNNHIGLKVSLCGWVHKIRNLGYFIFIDMRDCKGIVQIVFNAKTSRGFLDAKKLTIESCIKIEGVVSKRKVKNINTELSTGDIEVIANSLLIFNISDPLPLDFYKTKKDSVRLKYRYLDLRQRSNMQVFLIRNKILNFIHNFMYINNFIHIETPILTKSTPEGSRDYIVPSRNYPGKFYALPQSPQLFKQMLMISGFDKYYQIAKCFRDEDLRSDRQPEFTQIDIETSFMNSKQIRDVIETMITNLWARIKKVNLHKFPVLCFEKSIKQYGTDKPDLRNPIKFIEISHLLDDNTCKLIYHKYKKDNSRIAAIKISKDKKLSRQKIKEYFKLLDNKTYIKLFYFKFNILKLKNKTATSLANKLFYSGCLDKLITEVNLKDGDILFFMGNKSRIVNKYLSILRLKIGEDLKLTKNLHWKPVWIVDFPLFNKNKDNTYSSNHHPFTAPNNLTKNELQKNPEKVISDSYDLVINGYEIGGGSVRVNNITLQKMIFNILNITPDVQKEKFGFFLESLKFGTPPHLGIALGLDRITMLLTETNSIHNVIAFPKTTESNCLITNAPSKIDSKALIDLNIQIVKNNKDNTLKSSKFN